MAIEADPYHTIKPGLDLGLLAARRMGPASWLTVPETQEQKEETTMGAEVKAKRPYNRKAKPMDVQAGGGQDMRHEEAKDPGIAREIQPAMSLLAKLAAPAVQQLNPNVIHLDFTGHEDLLASARSSSVNLEHDIIALLQALLDGKLCATDGSVFEA